MLIKIDRESRTPLYTQIKKQVRELILSGSLSEGSRLPSTRKLSDSLEVNRSTVVKAYQSLWSDGLVEGRAGGGTVVTTPPSVIKDESSTFQPILWEDRFTDWKPPFLSWIDKALLKTNQEVIAFDHGAPPSDLFPLDTVQEILTNILAEGPDPIRYSAPQGIPELRQLLSEQMNLMGIKATPSQILILSGSEQGIYITVQALIEPEDGVVVEAPTYPGVLRTLRAHGAQIYTVPMDEQGIKVDILEGVLSHQRPKLIYTMPTFHNPTGITMSLKRRKKLLGLAYRYRVPILEDTPYYHLRYTGGHLPPIKALDQKNHVLYLSTFSKSLFPGLRVGWLVASKEVVKHFTSIKKAIDLCTSALSQYIVCELIRKKSGHLKRVLPIYKTRRDAMRDALASHCGGSMNWKCPQGGFFIWAGLKNGLQAVSLQREALENGVSFVPGWPFFPGGTGGDKNIRLSFARLSEDHIEEGVRRLATALQKSLQKKSRSEQEREAEEADRPLV